MTTYRLSNLAAELHVGDVGTEIIVTIYDITEVGGALVQNVPLDLTGYTVTVLLCGVRQTIERATELVGLEAAGTVKAVTQAGDLAAGPLTIRCKLVSTGGTWYTASVVTKVWTVC